DLRNQFAHDASAGPLLRFADGLVHDHFDRLRNALHDATGDRNHLRHAFAASTAPAALIDVVDANDAADRNRLGNVHADDFEERLGHFLLHGPGDHDGEGVGDFLLDRHMDRFLTNFLLRHRHGHGVDELFGGDHLTANDLLDFPFDHDLLVAGDLLLDDLRSG